MNNKKTEDIKCEDRIEKQDSDESNSMSFESNVDTSFFYTNDKFINQLDNNEVLQFIQLKYPLIDVINDDPVIKKQLVLMLEDEKYIQQLLKHFELTIFDLFGILYKQFSTIFKGPYLKKLKSVLFGKKYIVNERKKYDY